MKIGIPRGLYFYYYGDLWLNFFKQLNIETVVSPKTNKEILDLGIQYSNDEMCQSLKIYLGHVAYLKNCDYILVPRIDNYGINNQTCTNFLATYDIVKNLFRNKILNYNIDLRKNETEIKGFYQIGKELNIKKKLIKKNYLKAKKEVLKKRKEQILLNQQKLDSTKLKILIVGHPYNTYDSSIGFPIINYLEDKVELIYSDLFDSKVTRLESEKLSKGLYFKYNKENIGSIPLVINKVDGIIFLSSFPCGPDSLVNELVIRKINKPYLNIIIDDLDSNSGLITRLESFIDILEVKNAENSFSTNG